MRSNTVRAALRRQSPQFGTWLTLASPLAARFMARAGFDWLTLDLEHSTVNMETADTIFGAIADAGGIPLARVPANSPENAKRVLDAGAFGVIFPMCCSAEEAGRAVAACRYPPGGSRSVGGGTHALNFGGSPREYYARANEEILVIVQIEHIAGVENCEAICSTQGVDAVFIGPNDLLSSMGRTPEMETEDREFVEALQHVRETAARCGIASGIHTANSEAAARRAAEGFHFIAIGSEMSFMVDAARSAAAEVHAGQGS